MVSDPSRARPSSPPRGAPIPALLVRHRGTWAVCSRSSRRAASAGRPARRSRVPKNGCVRVVALLLSSLTRPSPSSRNSSQAFSLPVLPYDYAALEPHIDATTMNIHHTKHHQT